MKRIEQEQHVEQWKASGLSQQSYCEKIGIKRTTFANWVGRKKKNLANSFVKITPSAQPCSGLVELIYPNGVQLKADPANLSLLIELIRSYPCSA